MIVDNIPENFKSQPNNGLTIKTWYDDIKDNQLLDILHILKGLYYHLLLDIYLLRVPDVRNIIKKVKDYYTKEKTYSNVDITLYI
jgi:TFIIF-interacting CTD phosphatase-like protein